MTMRRSFAAFFPILAAAMMFYFCMPVQSDVHVYADATYSPGDDNLTGTPANHNLKTSDPSGQQVSCSDLPEAKGGVVLGHIVPCIAHTIETSTTAFTQKMITFMQPIFYTFLTLVVTLFGVHVVQGERQVHVQGFVLLLKVALVIGILEMVPDYFVPAAYGIISQGVQITTNALGPDASGISCDISKYGDDQTPMLWKQMDCVIGKLYGFSTGNGAPGPDGKQPVNMLMAASAIGLLSGFVFGGTFGVAVFFALLGVLISVAMLVIRTAMTFLNGYMIVCVMLLISPIFMPLVLLKVSSEYFEKWWKAILGGLLLPIIISAYSMFAMIAYDKLMFQPNSPLQVLFKKDLIKDAMQQPRNLCDLHITGDPTSRAPDASQDDMNKIVQNPYLHTMFGNPLASGASNLCGLAQGQVFDVTKIKGPDGKPDPQFTKKKDTLTSIFTESISLMLMIWLIEAGLTRVEDTIASLTAGSSIGSGFMHAAPGSLEANIGNSYNRAQQSMSAAFDTEKGGSASGAEFIKDVPKGAQAFGNEFFGGIMRK